MNSRKEEQRKYYLANKEKINKRNKNWYKKHRNQVIIRTKKWNQNHKRKVKMYNKKFKEIHKIQLAYKVKIRRKKDINFKLNCYLRTRIYQVLKGINKSINTIKLLGCSIKQLKQHLQKQFKSGMSWNNYGLYGWHIDHIRPCASFDLSKPKEQRKCFNYTNLQPLWAEENLSKNKY